jgi:hypothetical protein
MNEGLKTIIAIIGTVVVVFAGIGVIIFYANQYQCNKYHEATGRETKLVAQTCFTKVQGEWYPVSQVRAIQ